MRASFFKNSFVWILLLAFALILALWFVRPKPPRVRLTDGSVLTLEKIVFQPASTNWTNSARQRWINTVRGQLANRLGIPHFNRPMRNESLVFWISRRDASGNYMDFDWWVSAELLDSHGCRFNLAQPMAHAPNWMSGGRPIPKAPAAAKYILASGVLEVFPRREKTFKLRFYGHDSELVGELEVPNPVFRDYPIWKPEAIPATHQDGELSVSLVGLTNQWTISRSGQTEIKSFILTPNFRFGSADAPNPVWELAAFDIEDATGNRSNVGPFVSGRFGGGMARWLPMRGWGGTGLMRRRPTSPPFVFCTNETAWKLRATFFRTAQAQFASNEIWRIPGVSIPSNGVAKTFDLTNTWAGTTVKLCAITGPGQFTISNGVPVSAAPTTFRGGSGGGSSSRTSGGVTVSELRWESGQPKIVVRVSPATANARLDCLARQGETVSDCPAGSASDEFEVFNMTTTNLVFPVDLIFVLQKPRLMEFLVRPPEPTDAPNRPSGFGRPPPGPRGPIRVLE